MKKYLYIRAHKPNLMKPYLQLIVVLLCGATKMNAQQFSFWNSISMQVGKTDNEPPVTPLNGIVRSTVVPPPNLIGVFSVNPTSGLVRATNCYPAGNYTAKMYGFNSNNVVFPTTLPVILTPAGCSQFLPSVVSNLPIFTAPFNLAIGDFNADGFHDLIFPGTIRFGNGSGGFPTSATVNSTSGAFNAVGDFNGDGNHDVAVTSSSGVGAVMLGGSGTTSTAGAIASTGGNGAGVAVCDANKDGKLDVLVANNNIGYVSLNLGNGLGGFGSSTLFATGAGCIFIAIADFNNDGNVDFTCTNQTANSVSVRLGNGLGSFSGTTTFTGLGAPRNLAVGDFNNDGNMDIAIANTTTNNVAIRLGDGAGNFSTAPNVTVGTDPRSIAVCDFNGDGNLDFATGNYTSNDVSVKYGDGAGNFIMTTTVPVGTGPRSILVADFNLDGRQDFVVANLISSGVSICFGQAVGEMDVRGNNISIADGSVSSSYNNYTNLGNVLINGSSTKTFKIKNTGSASIRVDALNLSGGDISQFSISALSSGPTIAAGDSATFTVTFMPTSGGNKSTTVHIFNTDCDEMDFNFKIEGAGICLSPPCSTALNLKLYIQGYYTGASTMNPVLFNQGVGSSTITSDSITVSLYDPITLQMVSSVHTLLQTNGTAICSFPLQYGNYFIGVKNRTSTETWSATPITFLASTSYDFSTQSNKAYGSNQAQVENGIWAFYSGDINQDLSIDAFDYLILDPDITAGSFGYLSTDLNGDGLVDAFDYLVMDANLLAGVGAEIP